ncbi:hypothetical protein HK104_011254 [Borealophlyctis nickersoniae]|nr:hypothetical protein HK104_011254 [Borealophlyctis nickersoniae]
MAEDLDKILSGLTKDLTMIDQADFKGRCSACESPVLGNEGPAISFTQDGVAQWYHLSCFKCQECKNTIDASAFFLHLEKPHCKECYQEKVLGKCDKCGKNITDTATMKAAGKKYHPACFACTKCSTELQSRYFEKDDSFYCRACFEETFLPLCAGCNERITPNADTGALTTIDVKDKKYHQSCFVCAECKSPFEDMKACPYKDGKLYCKECLVKVSVPKA